ncbi:hypothetical protein M0802_012899 [Mischocyttarus mexicanus]|nr:hypothetical protein M0802_012899 [Mischocyttarus mexicanus]
MNANVSRKKMNMNDVVWSTEANYALGTYKYITWTTGTWPLKKEGLFTMMRFGIAFALEFGILVSVLMEIQLNCGTVDETLDFFALTAVTIASLTKLTMVKVHREDLQRIILSALKDWTTATDNSMEKQILWKYTRRGKLLCRIQMGFGVVIITAMTLDALLAAISFEPANGNSSEEIYRQTPLRTMCIFGDMTTTTYWTVFVFQAIQMINAIAVDMGNDVFFFGIAMHICSQLHTLKIFFDKFQSEDSKERVQKIEEFVNRHSHVLDLAKRLEDTYNNVLLAVLMADGLHICLAGIHILLLSKQYDMVQLLKTSFAFLVVLAQLFLYSYTGEYLSTLSQDICNVIYHFPWYECSPSTVKNVIFIIMRSQEPHSIFASPSLKMDTEKVVWSSDATYALGTYKFITWTTGTWPLQDQGIFTMFRYTISFILEFSLLASILLEIRLNCGDTDKTLEFFGLTAGMVTGLTKLIFVKLHQEDLRKIILSALNDWSSIIDDNSSIKEIILKYAHRGKLVCRVQMSLGLLIIAAMILDAVPSSESSQQSNETFNEDDIRQIPLRTMCLFGNMSTSTYWTVFVLQSVQLLNSIAVNMGNDVFFFGIAMHICGQLETLKIFCDEFKANDEKDRLQKIEEFVHRHSHLLEMAQLLENTFTNILLVNLMTDGLHTCLAGIQIIFISTKIDIVPLAKVGSVIIIILAQLFLYSYADITNHPTCSSVLDSYCLSQFGTLISILMEIRLSCGSTDETLDFFGISLSTVAGLTKLIFIKLHRDDLRKILSSTLLNWSAIVDGSSAKKIMLKYSQRGNFVARMQMSFAFVIITTIILDAMPLLEESSQQDNITSSEEFLPKRIPLRTMCVFGNMSTSTYWTVFVLQAIQLFNAVLIESGNDVFFFGISMQICGQLNTLQIFFDKFQRQEEVEENRVKEIKQFVDEHSHLLNLTRRIEDTFHYVLLVLLMTNGLHICSTGIQILMLSKQNDIVPLIKAVVAFFVILIQLFLYSYAGDFLSSLTQDIRQMIYDYPWYEFSSNNAKNFVFIIMRAHKPFRLRAGKFYPIDLESFKNILKASFSYFSVLRIAFEE